MFEDPRIPPDVQVRIKDGFIGDYKILSVIGAGGMGAVFKCHDRKLKREVAVKILLTPGDGKNIQRFLDEARILGRLSHPNIVQVHDVGYDGHVPFFVMELVEGESLSDRLDRLGRLPVEETRDIICQIATGLAAVHKLGVIHRDIKAANVIVNGDGLAKLLDFGIARPLENHQHLTSQGLVMGTPSSMAPEQLRGEDLDQRADVYAVGVLLYHLLTGQRPYEGEDPTTLAREQEKHPPTRVKMLRAETPDDMVKVLEKALSKGKDDRYWNCEELLRDLAPEALLPGLSHGHSHHAIPIPAQDLSLATKAAVPASLLARQRHGMYALGGIGLALLVAGGATGARVWTKGCLRCEATVAGVEGRPAMTEATGVFLWHDGRGWHLRAKSVDAARLIEGEIRSSGGAIEAARGIDGESADRIEIDGRHAIRFRFEDPGPGQGVDFRLTEGCIEVTASVAGKADAALLHAGTLGEVPRSLPARYCR